MDTRFAGKDLISIEQLRASSVRRILAVADHLENLPPAYQKPILTDINIAVLFYQPSTRTYFSFMRAGQLLGANVIGIHGMDNFSSAYKGETLIDTVRTIEALATDIIVLRHFDDDSALIAANATSVPIINAGSGKLEHPTQALLDLRTILVETGQPSVEGLTVLFVGDLKNGRTVHSLSKLLALMGCRRFIFDSPPQLKMPRNLVDQLALQDVVIEETNNLPLAVQYADVIYDTRVQKEWFRSDADYQQAKDSQQITPAIMSEAKSTAVLMHPLPRVDEISPDVDADPRAAYFRQVNHGLAIRKALLALISGRMS
ncbi:aspartate carbamoyltransferase [Candidatus Collierbacteria bacterium RIFOXYB1_FULL_49_13]|uniref:Aspartate carbamoyltransferase n=1 Tax=Candidatus Collierbacteria bacterium RIFOXYB1_FULL_49_13 TaxID=1817728 RepID=A0A1F5FJL0_9BACT|nr:MAG: aspartate carbamoyltransferase [Candidatus Collierbacteria bacterium RIFOXYB1_FULL_49_13]